MRYQTWEPAEEQMLIELYAGMKSSALADMMGRTAASVKQKAKLLKLRKSREFMRAMIRDRPVQIGRPTAARDTFMAAVTALIDAPMGAGMSDMAAMVGGKHGRVKSLVAGAVKAGILHSAGAGHCMRYFRTADAAQDGVVAIAQGRVAAQRGRARKNNEPRRLARAKSREERGRAKAELRRVAQEAMALARAAKLLIAKARPTKAPKPAKVAVPKMPRLDCRRPPGRPRTQKRIDDRPAVNPRKVRPVVIPCGVDQRYTVHTVAEPYFSAQQPGQYPGKASAWVPR